MTTNPETPERVLTSVEIVAHRNGGWIVRQEGTPGLWSENRRYTKKMVALGVISDLMGQLR